MQTERSEVCTSDRSQDSPIQTDLARLIRAKYGGDQFGEFTCGYWGLKELCHAIQPNSGNYKMPVKSRET